MYACIQSHFEFGNLGGDDIHTFYGNKTKQADGRKQSRQYISMALMMLWADDDDDNVNLFEK